MKIRIKNNSIRFRLTKTDVAELKANGVVKCQTVITPSNVFVYELAVNNNTDLFSASYNNAVIKVCIPASEAKVLTDTEAITIKGWQENGERNKLYILVEKDLQCLDPTHEDQSDMYPNPNSSCS